MTAPERIWATSVTENYGEWQTTTDGLPRPTEYVRADLVMARCSSCDGTGDVHRADGEWLGECDCGGEFRHTYDVEANPSKAFRVIQSLSADRDFWKDRFQVETRARIEAEALASTGAVKVKPLEWGPYHNPVFAGPDIAVASFSVFGLQLYQAQRDPQGPGFIVFLAPKYGTEFWSSKSHADLDEAKAAAQADFDRRLLSALESATPEGQQCRCDKCNAVIELDVHVPDEIWKRISPKPIDGYKGGGLLCPQCIVDALARPSEQAVTEAMVEAAISIMFHKHGWFPPKWVVKDALKAAMEAGR